MKNSPFYAGFTTLCWATSFCAVAATNHNYHIDGQASQPRQSYAATVAVPAPVDIAIAATPPNTVWKIKAGEKIIGDAIQRWTQDKWRLVSEVNDMTADIDIEMNGAFEDVIGRLIDAVNQNGAGWSAKFYSEVNVLRIVEKK